MGSSLRPCWTTFLSILKNNSAIRHPQIAQILEPFPSKISCNDDPFTSRIRQTNKGHAIEHERMDCKQRGRGRRTDLYGEGCERIRPANALELVFGPCPFNSTGFQMICRKISCWYRSRPRSSTSSRNASSTFAQSLLSLPATS